MENIGVPYRPQAVPGDGAATYVVFANYLDYRECIIKQAEVSEHPTYAEARIAANRLEASKTERISCEILGKGYPIQCRECGRTAHEVRFNLIPAPGGSCSRCEDAADC